MLMTAALNVNEVSVIRRRKVKAKIYFTLSFILDLSQTFQQTLPKYIKYPSYFSQRRDNVVL